jgi:peptidoglycan/LPS O-acetylase OafA/YrhL
MGKSFSIYLDLVRFVAACLVYMYHSNQRLLVQDILPASDYGHSAVTVFFVLSGFVIAFITDTKERHWATYAASRISRVYSVALPAVFITIGLDAVGRQLFPALYAYPFDQFGVRTVSSLLLLNETWFVSITSFSNVPYWSICYEMWYYIAFGLVMFLPRRMAWLAVVTLALMLGPKIPLLAPIWLLGVLLYRWEWLRLISAAQGWVLVMGSIVGIVVFHHTGVSELVATYCKQLVGVDWHAQFTFSKFFPSDYLLGTLVFLNFAGMRRVSDSLAPLLLPLERPIRWLASYTLSLYLLHQPLFLFWAAVLRGDPNGHVYWALTTALVLLSVWAIGWVTENKRHVMKRWLEQRFIRAQAHFYSSHAAKN